MTTAGGGGPSVLHVVTDTDRRGGQTFGVELSRHLEGLGVDSRVVALEPGHSGSPLPVDVLGSSRRDVSGFRALRRAMRAADVTVAHGSSTLPACGAASLGSPARFVYRQISDPLHWSQGAVRRQRVRAYYRLPDHVVALSDATADVLVEHFGVRRDRLSVLPNAVDPERFTPTTPASRAAARTALGLDAGARVVAYLGALGPEKGVDDLLAALQPGWRLVVAGDGPLRSQLGSAAASSAGEVTFLGAVDDPAVVLHAADVLALPSLSEQQPAVLVEAALCELPVVATSVGQVADLVVDGTTGLLVEPGRSSELHGALASLLGDPELAARAGRAGRQHALEHFSLPAVAPRWLALLSEVAAA